MHLNNAVLLFFYFGFVSFLFCGRTFVSARFYLTDNGMANLITRLIMDASKYDSGLQKAQKSIDKFIDKNTSLNNVMKGAQGTIAKMAGTLGIAVGAGEAFNKVLNSSQVLGDATAATIESAKKSIDEFFYSLGSGDFSAFINGLDNIIAKSKEAHSALDQLGNTKISFDFYESEFDEAIAKARLNAKNKQLDEAERKKAFKAWDDELKKKEEAGQTVANDALDALTKSIVVGTQLRASDINFEDFRKVMKIDLMPSKSRSEAKSYWTKQYEDYRKLADRIESDRRVDVARTNDYGRTKSINDAAKIAQEGAAVKYKDAIIYNTLLNKLSDDELIKLKELGKQYYSVSQLVSQQRQEFNESTTEFNNSITASAKAKETAAAAAAKAIKEAKEKNIDPFLGNEQLNEEIKAVISGKDAMSQEVLDAIGTGKTLPILTQPIQATMINSEDEVVEGEDPADALRRKLEMYTLAQSKIQEYTNMLSVANEEEKAYLNEQIEIWRRYSEEIGIGTRRNGTDELASDLDKVSDALIRMGGLSDSVFGSMLSYVGGISGAVVSAIPAIEALTASQMIQANANTKAAVSGAASSVANIPIVGPMLAVSAVASVLAAIMNIPNFAEGGIVGGHNYMDGITARVSSGEMFINEADQKKLYDSIHSGDLGGGNSGRTVITGEQIVTVVNNYGKRTGKGVILKG